MVERMRRRKRPPVLKPLLPVPEEGSAVAAAAGPSPAPEGEKKDKPAFKPRMRKSKEAMERWNAGRRAAIMRGTETNRAIYATERNAKQRRFLQLYRQLGTISAAMEVMGYAHGNISHHLAIWKKDPGFKEALKAVQEAIADELETEAIRRAKDGSDKLLMFLLRGHKPEKFKDRIDHGGSLTFTIPLEIVGEGDKNAPGLRQD